MEAHADDGGPYIEEAHLIAFHMLLDHELRIGLPGGAKGLAQTILEPHRIGVELSEEYQLHPEQSTDAIVIHHPEAKYFNAR